jgi:hypothetical protein
MRLLVLGPAPWQRDDTLAQLAEAQAADLFARWPVRISSLTIAP